MKFNLPGGLTVSRLGFGCSGLMAKLSRRESLRLLEIAFENGITHFDTARMYGYGEAESVLGEFMAPRRSAVTVTTKAGILPPKRRLMGSVARAAARRIAGMHPMLRRAVRRKAEAMIQHGCFDPASVRSSIETSLRELRTDCIDVVLLHDCSLEDLETPGLDACLGEIQRRGLVKHFGLATTFEVIAQARPHAELFTRVVQFPCDLWQDRTEGWLANRAVFTHSALGIAFAELRKTLAIDATLARSWSDRLGFDAQDIKQLAHAFLSAALSVRPEACVLFSSQRLESVASNAKVEPNPEILRALRELAPGGLRTGLPASDQHDSRSRSSVPNS